MTTPGSGPKSVSCQTKLLITVVLLAALGLGVYLVQRGLQSVETALESKRWPITDGTITRSSVKVSVTRVREKGRDVPNKQSRTYSPDIEYRYTVDGQQQTGTRVSVEDASIGTQASAKRIVDQYPVGKTIKVSYQPEQPAVSVLEPGDWTGTYRWFVPGGGLALISLLLVRGIWSEPQDPQPSEVAADENHPARPRLLGGALMVEEIVCWEPGETVHIRRARVGFLKSIAGAVIAGLFLGLFLGLLPAVFWLSGRGVIFIARFYLAVSALLTVAFAIGLILHGRRREYLLDWTLGEIHWEIGWRRRQAPLHDIESLTLKNPAKQGERTPVVDAHTIKARIQGRTYTLLETNGFGQSWSQTRDRMVRLVKQLADALNVPWTESHEQPVKRA